MSDAGPHQSSIRHNNDYNLFRDATLTRSCFLQKQIGAKESGSKILRVKKLLTLTTRESPRMVARKAMSSEAFPMTGRKIELQAGHRRGISQFALAISRASSDRTYPGGLPCFDRTASQSPAELSTLIRVP